MHHGWAWGTENVEILHAVGKVSSQSHITVRLKNEKYFLNEKNLIQNTKLLSQNHRIHWQLLLLLVHWSYQKKITHAMFHNREGLCRRSMETKSAYYCTYRWIIGMQ